MDQPNPVRAFLGVVKALITTDPPNPVGEGSISHDRFRPVLRSLEGGGLAAASESEGEILAYLDHLSRVRPDHLSRDEAIAYWLNLYNAGAVRLGVEAHRRGETSVLRIPGAFSSSIVGVAGESLSLDDIEHGKLRRFEDPRIHGALVCGSLSCPTLRNTPYEGRILNAQLDDQMRSFLAEGGAVLDTDGTIWLSRIFLWFGADFVRPHRMPTFLPASRADIHVSLRPWLGEDSRQVERVAFQSYDWSLSCAVG